jgi:hypothetical protein
MGKIDCSPHTHAHTSCGPPSSHQRVHVIEPNALDLDPPNFYFCFLFSHVYFSRLTGLFLEEEILISFKAIVELFFSGSFPSLVDRRGSDRRS